MFEEKKLKEKKWVDGDGWDSCLKERELISRREASEEWGK